MITNITIIRFLILRIWYSSDSKQIHWQIGFRSCKWSYGRISPSSLSIHSLLRRTNGHLTKTVSQSRAEWSRVQSWEEIQRILPGYSRNLGPQLCMSSVIFWLLRWQCTFPPPLSFARSGVRKFGTAFKCARCPSWIIPQNCTQGAHSSPCFLLFTPPSPTP